jgi:hypothetical protein
MLYRVTLSLFLLFVSVTAGVDAQTAAVKPLTKSEVFSALEAANASEELIAKTNEDLIEEIAERGVDFVLTPDEEWSLQLRDASDKLLAAIRDAIDPKEREFRINVQRQQRLYNNFAQNFNGVDLASRQTALLAAREFLGLYANDPNVAEIITFMQKNIPRLQQSVAMLQQREAAMERTRAQALEREQMRERQRIERDRERAERENRRKDAAANNPRRTDGSDSAMPALSDNERRPVQPTDNTRRNFPVVRRP